MRSFRRTRPWAPPAVSPLQTSPGPSNVEILWTIQHVLPYSSFLWPPQLHSICPCSYSERTPSDASLLLPVLVLRVAMSRPPGLLAECPGLCGQRPRCLSRRPTNGSVLSIPPNITCGRVYSKWCIHYMKSLCGRISRLFFFERDSE